MNQNYFSTIDYRNDKSWTIHLIKADAASLPRTTEVWQTLMFTDWPLPSSHADQEEIGGHAESRPLLPANWAPDAPLQSIHHDDLQRALWGQSPECLLTPGLKWPKISSSTTVLCIIIVNLPFFVWFQFFFFIIRHDNFTRCIKIVNFTADRLQKLDRTVLHPSVPDGTDTQLCVSLGWFVSLLLSAPVCIFMTPIPSPSPPVDSHRADLHSSDP